LKYFKTHKNRKMKKVLAIALIAASLTACNNSGDKKSATDSTTTVTAGDTTTKVTTNDTTVNKAGDSTMKKTTVTDSTKK
jgi:ABC-type oligopeptide transport system substrate-binding subunit